MSKYSNNSNVGGCGCYIAILVFNLLFGGWSVNWLLETLFSKNISFFWDAVIGLFVGEISIPVAVIGAILRHFGVL